MNLSDMTGTALLKTGVRMHYCHFVPVEFGQITTRVLDKHGMYQEG